MFHDFDYIKPNSVKEVLTLLAELGERCRLLAGGTVLLVDMRDGHLSPEALLDIGDLPALRFIRVDRGMVRIGPATTLAEIAESSLLPMEVSFLAKAAASVGGPQIRSRATIGGNLAYASPGADMAPPLLALGATLRLTSERGHREVSVDEFFAGPRSTVCGSDEIVTEISFPYRASGRGAFIKLGLRNAMAISLASVGVWIEMDPSKGIVEEARIALGAVAPTPIRAKAAEELLRGERASVRLIERAAELAREYVRPRPSSIRSSGEYRRIVTGVLIRRALEKCLDTGDLIA